MKTCWTVIFSLFAAGIVSAHELVTNVVVRQRQPWGTVVDIDYLYTGLCPTSMSVTATWDGQTTPVSIVSLDSDGIGGVTLGEHTITWDPAASGYGVTELKNFKVDISPTARDPRTYLVIDLQEGGYSMMAAAPGEGWTDEYKTRKLVLKRVYKGTYRWGTTEAEYRAAWSGGQSGAIGRGATIHDVTYTSDYYFPIFELTTEQYNWIVNGAAGNGSRAKYPLKQNAEQSYTVFRGAMLDDGVTPVCWPQTGHSVNSSSFIGKLRAIIARKNQVPLLADLPTVDQWQLPMCGGRNTFWPNGGDSSEKDLDGVWQGYMNAICHTASSGDGWEHPVGEKNPNDWGFYDFFINWNPCLDWINASSTVDNNNPSYFDRGDRTDDPGSEIPTPFTGAQAGKTFRVMCGQIARDAIKPGYANTIFTRTKIEENVNSVYMVPRVVVNLKALVK